MVRRAGGVEKEGRKDGGVRARVRRSGGGCGAFEKMARRRTAAHQKRRQRGTMEVLRRARRFTGLLGRRRGTCLMTAAGQVWSSEEGPAPLVVSTTTQVTQSHLSGAMLQRF